MTEWCETKLDDDNKFEIACPPQQQEFELVGERQADGRWQCILNRYPGGTVNTSVPVQGQAVAHFLADSPEHAKQVAEQELAAFQKRS